MCTAGNWLWWRSAWTPPGSGNPSALSLSYSPPTPSGSCPWPPAGTGPAPGCPPLCPQTLRCRSQGCRGKPRPGRWRPPAGPSPPSSPRAARPPPGCPEASARRIPRSARNDRYPVPMSSRPGPPGTDPPPRPPLQGPPRSCPPLPYGDPPDRRSGNSFRPRTPRHPPQEAPRCPPSALRCTYRRPGSAQSADISIFFS